MRWITRREFVRRSALLGLGGSAALTALACARPSVTAPSVDAAPPAPAPVSPPLTFTPPELATVAAVCERLLPRDADPGAIDLGVPGYIDRMLASPDLASIRKLIVRTLPLLD